MSMFQILTQEGWVGPLDGVLETIGDNSALRIVVGFYFILFHLFVSVVSKGFRWCNIDLDMRAVQIKIFLFL